MSDYSCRGLTHYWPTVFVMIFFVIGCSVGIDIHSKCKTAQDSALYNNLRETLNYGLTIGITSLMTLSFIKFSGSEHVSAKGIGLLFALISVITSGMSLGMFYKCKNENSGDRKKSLEAFAWLSIILPIIAGSILAMSN